jgi:thymidine phosphorylase
VIDIPVGPTAKVRTDQAAGELASQLRRVGRNLGLSVFPVITDGTQPIGRGIGPALEARDVLAVLRNQADAPADLRDRAVLIAGHVLEACGAAAPGEGSLTARRVIEDGRAWRKFQAICEAQGGMREPSQAQYRHEIRADGAGLVTSIDNRRIARAAKLAGAPLDPAAGIDLRVRIGAQVCGDEPLFVVHAESPGQLAYALGYLGSQTAVVQISG